MFKSCHNTVREFEKKEFHIGGNVSSSSRGEEKTGEGGTELHFSYTLV